jgi:hypothetical protein
MPPNDAPKIDLRQEIEHSEWKDATFEKGSDLVKFLVQLPLPIVTLAVGYYLGDRNRPPPPTRTRK